MAGSLCLICRRPMSPRSACAMGLCPGIDKVPEEFAVPVSMVERAIIAMRGMPPDHCPRCHNMPNNMNAVMLGEEMFPVCCVVADNFYAAGPAIKTS